MSRHGTSLAGDSIRTCGSHISDAERRVACRELLAKHVTAGDEQCDGSRLPGRSFSKDYPAAKAGCRRGHPRPERSFRLLADQMESARRSSQRPGASADLG